MNKSSAIREYYRAKQGLRLVNDRYEEHFRRQEMLLNAIYHQSKPQFWRDVGANIVGSAIWDGILIIGRNILKR